MYSKEQITFLMQNGFTVDEIMKMSAPQETPIETPAPATDNRVSEVIENVFKGAEDFSHATARAATDDRVDKLVGTVENLVRMMQTNNINSMQFGSPVADRTAGDVIAEIINPKPKK